MTDDELKESIAKFPYWYHRVRLRDGIETPGWAPLNESMYGVPERLDGEKIADIGSWDGFWCFLALNRGARHVYAIEDFSDTTGEVHNADRSLAWGTFDLCADALGFMRRIRKHNASIEWDGPYNGSSWDWFSVDRVFIFGVLYHLRNPLKALQSCFDMLKSGGVLHCETAILDNLTSPYTGQPHDPNGCYAEFYPTNEFGKNSSNWWVPTLKCAAAMLQAAGFVDIETWKLTDEPVHLAQCRGFLRARKP